MDTEAFNRALDSVYGNKLDLPDEEQPKLSDSFENALNNVYSPEKITTPKVPVVPAAPTLTDTIIPAAEPVQTIIPEGMESALDWTTPVLETKPELPPGPKLNITPSNRHLYPHLTDEQAREHEKVFEFGDILPSLESGYKRTWGNILNLMADKERAYRENPDLYLEKIAGLSPYAALGASMDGLPSYDEAAKLRSQEHEEKLLAEGSKYLKESSDLGRHLTWEETENFSTFLDYLTGLAGQTAPSMLAGMVSMGTASPMLLEAELNAELRQIPDLSSEDQLRLAERGGLIAGALEVVGLGIIARGIPKSLLGKMGVPRITSFVEKHAGKNAATQFATKVTGRVGVGMAGEGLTETGQEEVLMAHEAAAGKEFTDEEKAHRRKEALAGGTFMGGFARPTIGAGQDLIGKLQERAADKKLRSLWDAEAQRVATELFRDQRLVPEPIQKPPIFSEFTPEPVTPVEEELTIPEGLEQAPVPPSFVESTPPQQVSPTEVQGSPATPPGLVVGKPTAPEVETEAKPPPPPTFTEAPEGPDIETIAEEPEVEVVEEPEAPPVEEAPVETEQEVEAEPEAVVEKPVEETPKEKPKEERVFKPLVTEKGKPESQVVIKALKGVRLLPYPDSLYDLPFIRLNPRKANELKIINKLVDRGYISEKDEGGGNYQLTPEGRSAALQIRENEELALEGLPMENYTPKKGRKTPTQTGGDVKFSPAEFEGGPSWSQGHILVKGEPPRGIPRVESENKNNFTPIIDAAPKMTKSNPSVDPIGFTIGDAFTRVHFAPVGVYEEGMQTTVINAEYYDFFKKTWSDAKFVMDEKAGSMKPISVYSGDEFVGIIMPMRNEGGPEPGFQKILTAKPAEVKPKAKPKAKPKVKKPPVEAPEMAEPKAVSSFPESREEFEKMSEGRVSPADLDKMFEPDVWEGLEEGKPTKLNVFHGKGKRAQYAEGVEGAALGDGRYSALKESDAKDFGDVTSLTVELKNPAVLEADKDLVKWFGEAIPSENSDRIPLLQKAREKMVKQGYDGVIINIPQMADVDAAGRSAKRLREIFDVSQVLEFKPLTAEQKIETALKKPKPLGDVLQTEKKTEEPQSKKVNIKRQIPQSIRELIYTDFAEASNLDESLSMDEKVAILRQYTPKKLEEVFSKMMEDKFGIRIIKATSNMDVTLDNLMDAYTNVEGMASALNFPLKAMGFDNSLSLQTVPRMVKLGGETLASYSPDLKRIKMGERNRSFAHEWMHALDFHIMEIMGNEWHNGGMSGRLRGYSPKAEKRLKNLRLSAKDLPDSWVTGGKEPWQEENTTERIKDAFGNLLNSIFFGDANVAAEIMALEEKIGNARSEGVIEGYRKDIEKLKLGMTHKHLKKTFFFTESESMEWQSEPYLTMPTELLARSFEAYMANRVELQSQAANYPGTEFITMPDWAYNDRKYTPWPIKELQNPKIDEMWEKIYPKDGDRKAIFDAYDKLFEVLAEDYFEGEAAVASASRIVTHPLLRDFETAEEARPWKPGAKQEAARRLAGEKNMMLQQEERLKQLDRWKDKKLPERAWLQFEDRIAHPYLFSKRAQLFSMVERYKNTKDIDGNPSPVSDTLTEILRRLIDDPGGRKLFMQEGDQFVGTWTETVRSLIRTEMTMFKKKIDLYDAMNFTEKQQQELRLLMTSDPATITAAEQAQIDPNVVKLAGELRILLNKLFKYGKGEVESAGAAELRQMTFLEDNAYLPRSIDEAAIAINPAEFKNQATKMFEEVLWENEIGSLDLGSIEQFKLIGEVAASSRMEFQRDGRSEEGLSSNPVIQKAAELYKDILNLERKIEGAEKKGDKKKIEALNEKLEELHEQALDLMEEAYTEVGHGWSVEHANEWYRKLTLPKGDSSDYGLTPSPFISGFTKKRKFPKEADTYMVDYYQPAIESISSYIQAIIKKTEFNKRFGPHHIKAHKKRDRYARRTRFGKRGEKTRDYLDWLLDEKLAMHMSENDFEMTRTHIMTILGRNPPPTNSSLKTVNWFHSVALTYMLTEAAATSFAEPFVAGIKMKSGMKGLQVFAKTLQEVLQYVSKDAQQTIQKRHQLANIFGVVDASGMADIAVNRLGGLMVDDPKTNRWVSHFFKITGLQGLTNAQRRSTMVMGFQWFKEIANQYQNPVGDNEAAISANKKEAQDILLEYGIPKSQLEEFANYMIPMMEGKKIPLPSDIMNQYGEMEGMAKHLSTAINRLVNRSIQDPEIASKPSKAEGPFGRMIYSIMGFSYSVHANVIKATYRDLKAVGPTESLASIAKEKDSAKRAKKAKIYGKGTLRQAQLWSKLAGPLAGLYIAHLQVTVLRAFLTDQDRWEKEKEKGTLASYLMELAFYRTGTLGALDPLAQAVRAVRYEADLSRFLIGATPGFWVQATNQMARVFLSQRNSPNTARYEKRGLEAFWRAVIGPMMILAATDPRTFSRLGPYASLGSGVFAVAGASDTAADWFSSMALKLLGYDETNKNAFKKSRGVRARKARRKRKIDKR